MSAVQIFKALGEPTRLEIVERLSHSHDHTLTSLSEGLGLTRQGARKHLQILANAHVVILLPNGRNTVVQLNRRTLDIGKKFIMELEAQWEKRLVALKSFIEKKK